ncbi:unnamed protein product [Symbiodinium sp. CCMP2456]|nr:unnamed protein product [Symbiodinium sp. CCMP2456]
MALHALLSLSLGVGSPEEEGKTAGTTGTPTAAHSKQEPRSVLETLLGPLGPGSEFDIAPASEPEEDYEGVIALTISSMSDGSASVEVSGDTVVEDLKGRAAQLMVLLPQRGTGSVLLDVASGKVLPGNETVRSLGLSRRSRLLLLGKSRLYAPKDLHVSAIMVYTQLGERKYVLGKPHCLRENEDLLLRMDTTEYGGTLSGVEIPGGLLGRFMTLPVGDESSVQRIDKVKVGQHSRDTDRCARNLHPPQPVEAISDWLNGYEVNLGITYGSLTGAFGPTNSSLSAKYHTLITPSGRVQGEQNERAKLQDQNSFEHWTQDLLSPSGAPSSFGRASLLWRKCSRPIVGACW